MRILVVEDDKEVAASLRTLLESKSFAVDLTHDGQEAVRLARSNTYDLVLLDMVLPGRSGLEICQDIRASQRPCYILILSVNANADQKALLLDAGADDYLTKPFSSSELLARINALFRRAPVFTDDVFQMGSLVLDVRQHRVSFAKQDIHLTRKEFALLEYLLRNKGTVLTRGMIMEHVWDMNADPFSNTLETHLVSLRKKIKSAGGFDPITTVSGVGYKITQVAL